MRRVMKKKKNGRTSCDVFERGKGGFGGGSVSKGGEGKENETDFARKKKKNEIWIKSTKISDDLKINPKEFYLNIEVELFI